MKVFRLVNAELRKIFLRPTIFIMIALLVIVSFISLIAFSPDINSTDSTIKTSGDTVGTLYNNFMQPDASTLYTTKVELDEKLDNSLKTVEKFSTDDLTLFNLKNKAYTNGDAQLKYHNMEVALETAARPANLAPSLAFSTANTALHTFKQALGDTIQLVSEFKNSNKYYLEESSFKEVEDKLLKLDKVVIAYESTQTQIVYQTMLSAIRKYDFDKFIVEFIDSVKPIKIENDVYLQIKKDYYDTAKTVLGSLDEEKTVMKKINDYYTKNAAEGGQEYREEFITLLADYKAYINVACENLDCAINLEVGKNISDKTMQTYLNYKDYNEMLLSSTLEKNAFLVNNNINPRLVLDTMTYGVNSGNETNAWDFICYSMNIISLLIIIFCVLICSKMIAGEQTGGTMKLLAIRPFSRNKILTGKLLSTMFFAMIFVVFSFLVSFFIGWAFYGLPGQMMIGVFNGANVIYTHPIVFCLFLMLSISLKIFIYVSIATMISILFRSYTGSSMISFGILLITLILNGVLATKSWFKYLPMSNFDLYKYFTTSQSATGFKAIFSSPLIIDTSFLYSFLYVGILILLLNIVSYIGFKKKDIA